MSKNIVMLYVFVENMSATNGEVFRLKIEADHDDLITLPDTIVTDYEATREAMISDGWEEMNDPPSRFRRSHAKRRLPVLLSALWRCVVAARVRFGRP